MKADKGRGAVAAARIAAAGALASALAAAPLQAQEPPPLQAEPFSLRGMTGLIDMPSARMQPDGQFSASISHHTGGFTHVTLNFQATPWLEGAFRYSTFDQFFRTGGTLYDRSFDAKLRLSPEGRHAPALAIGLQDFLGTGVLSGEYLVATKSVAPSLTLTGGLGWGRFSGINSVPNPLRSLPGRGDRGDQGQTTGVVQFGNFFSGREMGWFAGAEWRPRAAPGLRLVAEYSPDEYRREQRFGPYRQNMPVNLGLDYEIAEGISLGAYWLYGSDVGLRLSVGVNPARPAFPQDLGPGPLPLRPRPPVPLGPAPELGEVVERIGPGPAPGSDAGLQAVRLDAVAAGVRWAEARVAAGAPCPVEAALDIDAALGVVDGVTFRDPAGAPVCSVVLRPAGRAHVQASRLPGPPRDESWHADPARREAAAARVLSTLEADGLGAERLTLDPRRARLDLVNPTYNAAPQAIGRAATALANELPASVEDFEIVLVERALPVVAVHLRRTDLEGQAVDPDALRMGRLGARITDAAAPVGPPQHLAPHPRFTWFVSPTLPVSLFDPDQPLRADLALVAGAEVSLAPGLSVSGAGIKRVVGNLDQITRQSDSTLPRVRSDFARYLAEGDPGIQRLTADYLFKLRPDTYGRVSAGLFERMFGGVSAEVLWKPAAQSWGLGAELNYARQRDFDMMLGFRDYDVITGHASLYWNTGWRGMEVQVDAGRYLAEDLGATFSLARRFANGWEVGGFFTLTDVPFDEFGEGSFDKGIRLTVPLRWGLPLETRSRATSTIRPLTRDGGARLIVENRLYGAVRDADAGRLQENWGNFWR